MLLKFRTKEDLECLFTCAKCESRTEDGEEKRMDTVIMDGTALGILGALPQFERITSVVPPIQRVSTRQDIMRTPKHRQFVDCVLLSGRKELSGPFFELKPHKRRNLKYICAYVSFVSVSSVLHRTRKKMMMMNWTQKRSHMKMKKKSETRPAVQGQ